MSSSVFNPSTQPKSRHLWWEDGTLILLDQTRLPDEEIWLRLDKLNDVVEAIYALRVRGAPAIGIAAAYGVLVGMKGKVNLPLEDFKSHLQAVKERLFNARPTAVNLGWALGKMAEIVAQFSAGDSAVLYDRLEMEAFTIHSEDIELCDRIAAHGAALFPQNARIITHCNTGFLATGGVGTALGVIAAAHKLNGVEMVYADETRPLLQGARLTAWECQQLDLPCRVMTDSSAAYRMASETIHGVIVGADRIAANGDTANKIGTYGLAVAARAHKVPFYVAAPYSTIDSALAGGENIPIEQRPETEVTTLRGISLAPEGTAAWAPAFDVTPAQLITAIITEADVFRYPYDFS
ncbi:MAG: S-methyl-5-thioribose-1-phosphate isomerase [Candidatus Marinimicrobia bacterium]|nr:S-methyl-5-thioribose-1-phosphate isomerase [Candidatus Neomarinimicrobiota bacterium]MCF7840743.1 S-methyl-5-thioribose-1-phosphate isomerase [Candidatus Neomarinimicrobiota bacterium]MCF7902363.1 S-methyl-5-thioribose-1-phosphate isomerase [Candidatus Neomarinimicrobiota bacterium]